MKSESAPLAHRHSTICRLAIVVLVLLWAVPAAAVLPEPDHTVYGTPRIDGVIATEGTVWLDIGGETLATYDLGSDPGLGPCDVSSCLFALRVAMDYGNPADPRPPATARPGDEAVLYLDGLVAGEVAIGDPGEAQALDIDTSFLPQVPGLSVVDVTAAEAAAGPFGLDVDVTLRLSFAVDDPVTVDWQTADATAVLGADYDLGTGVATFSPGETLTTVTVTIFDDAAAEADPAQQIPGEHFYVVLSNPSEASLLDAIGMVTIVDDDTEPALRVSNLSVVEPPAGAVDAAFTVQLSHPWDVDVTFDYLAVAETAQATDFELAPGAATIPAGSLAVQIPVRILADGEPEGDETFQLELANPVAASLRAGGGRGTILESPRLLTWVESQHDGVGGAEGLLGAIDVTLSPDGAHLYTAGRGDHAVSVWSRAAGSGRLELVASYRDDEGGLEHLDGVEALAVSPDGGRVYAASFDLGALSVLERDAATGRLSLVEVERSGHRDLESGSTVEGLEGAIALVVAPADDGGEHVYAAGSDSDSLAAFRRDPSDGRVRFEQVLRDGEAGVDGLGRVVALALSPDGLQVYAAALNDSSLAVFERDPLTGGLAFVELHSDGSGGVDGLAGAAAVAVSADGASVYAVGQADGAVAVFDRDPSGTLTFRESHFDGVGTTGLALATDVAVSRDGAYVFVTGFSQDALVVFIRQPDGSLAPLEVQQDDTGGVDGLDGATALVVSSDDAHVYATGTLDDAVAVFRRDLIAPNVPVEFFSTSHAPGGVSTSTSIQFEWSGAEDDETGSGVANYRLLLDSSPATVPGPGDGTLVPHGLDAHSATSEPQPDGDRWAHLLVCDHAGNCAVAHTGPFGVDTTPPAIPTLGSTSHQVAVWSHETTIEVQWSGATDPRGVAGYSFVFDTSTDTLPDETLDLPQGTDPHLASSASLPDGDSYYFHLRSCDVPGNCSGAVHLGPFWIETVPPSPVTGLLSTSHPTDDTSTLQVIDIVWDASSDTTSGVAGYAVAFDLDPSWSCDQVIDVGASTTQTSSPTLPDGTWYAHVCAVDEAGNWTEAASVGPYAISTAPATVTAVATVADTGDGLLDDGESTQIPITQLAVDFSRPMADPPGNTAAVDVTNPDSWTLVADGGDGSLETTDCSNVAVSDQQVALDRVEYFPATRRAQLWFVSDLALAKGRHRLLGCAGGLHDEADDPLDGDANGIAGGDFVLDFTVLSSNLLRNPNLDGTLAAWMLIGSGVVPEHDEFDADGLPTSGSAVMAGPGTLEDPSAISQCLAVESGELALRARLRIDSPGAQPPIITALAEFFTTGDCQGPPFGSFGDSTMEDTGSEWISLEAGGTAPAGASSALVSFSASWNEATATDVYFDVLYFGESALIFSDGFESGDTSLWSVQVPPVP